MAVAFSVDLELLRHARAYRELDDKPDLEIDLNRIIDRILDLLDRTGNNATFYVVAEIAEQWPALMQRIHAGGHEIGSHTYTHRLLPGLSGDELETEIVESKRAIESVIGSDISGFRAPELDHDERSLRLVSKTYEYDSSAIDAIPIPGFYASWDQLDSNDPQLLEFGSESIEEIPLNVNPFLKTPVSGAWIRLLGERYTLWSLRSLVGQGRVPVFYLHPRAFHPISASTGLPRRIYHRSGEWTFDTLGRILSEFNSVTVSTLLERIHSR